MTDEAPTAAEVQALIARLRRPYADPEQRVKDELTAAAALAALTAERDKARAGWDKALWELEQNRASHLVDIATHNGAGWQLRRDKDGWQQRAEQAEAALRQAVPREPTEAMQRAGVAAMFDTEFGGTKMREFMLMFRKAWRAAYDAAPAAAPGEKT